MATDDPYVYIYEDEYTSDDEDIPESLVNGIVEEAFRNENLEAKRNLESPRRPPASDSDLESKGFNHRPFSSDECLPMIKITEIPDDADLNRLDAPSNSSDNLKDFTDNKPKCTVSDGFLPEKTVRFSQTTPISSKPEKRKYPTTPKCPAKDLGPSLSPLKPQGGKSAAEPEASVLTCLAGYPDSPLDTSVQGVSPPIPSPLTGSMPEADSDIVKFEEELIKLNCAFTKLEESLDKKIFNQEEPLPNEKDSVKPVEEDLKEVSTLMHGVNKKWTEHKKFFEEFLLDSRRLERDHGMKESRLQEMNDLVTRLRGERRDLEDFLQEKEYEWFLTRKTMRADANFVKGLVKEAQQCRDNETLWKVLDTFLLIYFDREKAIALDTNKQNKMNELRLLICRQQLHLAELEERNQELEFELVHQQAGQTKVSSADRNSSCCSVSDVLYCDHARYSPVCSTNPQFAALHTLNIGGPHPDLVVERKEPMDAPKLCRRRGVDKEELAKFDHLLLKELTEHGPGSQDFRLE